MKPSKVSPLRPKAPEDLASRRVALSDSTLLKLAISCSFICKSLNTRINQLAYFPVINVHKSVLLTLANNRTVHCVQIKSGPNINGYNLTKTKTCQLCRLKFQTHKLRSKVKVICPLYLTYRTKLRYISCMNIRDVTDSKSTPESDGIRHFSRNPKSIGYLKSDCNRFKILVLVEVYNYFRK